ncbi:MAG: helix-turn-helix transcriptional regulator [Bacteroidales bacterium]|nr:helix-turn-helix transcriptional regulator [Bacteroidales bacterium]
MKPSDTEKIEQLMKKKGITAVDLAKIVGLTANGLRIAIREHGDFRLSQIIKMAQYFNVDPRDLISNAYLEDKGLSKKEYINNRLNLIFKELASTISMVVEDPGSGDEGEQEYNRLLCEFDKLIQGSKNYSVEKFESELVSILEETESVYKKSTDSNEKQHLKDLKEKINKARSD